MAVRAVLLDFFGTLARATSWGAGADVVLADRGYELPTSLRERLWNDGLDGAEHDEHSVSRDHYIAWQQERLLGMLAECDVHPDEYAVIVERIEAGRMERTLEAYAEAAPVLADLRARGLQLAVCSNWDWDLEEAMEEVGLRDAVDVLVSSAWVGARKPHPRIFRHTLELVGVSADEALFVGDTWGPDVEGPRALGLRTVYLTRDGHWDDPGVPSDPTRVADVAVDLRGIGPLLDQTESASA